MGWQEDMEAAGRRARESASGQTGTDWDEEMRAAARGERNHLAENMDAPHAFGESTLDSFSLGLSQQLPAVGAGLGAILQGGDYASAYSRRVSEAMARQHTLSEQFPLAYAGGQLAGMGAWMAVPVIGEAADVANAARTGMSFGDAWAAVRAANRATGIGEAGTINRATQSLRNAVNLEWLPLQRRLTAAARAGGARGALAEFGKAGVTGVGYGAAYGAGHADWSNPGEAANQTFGGGVGGGLGGAAFRGVFGAIGARDPAWRTLAGGVIGTGAGAVLNPTGDRAEGAAIGAAGGAALGRVFNPALLGWARTGQPVTRALSGAVIGGGGATLASANHNAQTPYLDEQVDVPTMGLIGAASGATAAYAIPELIQRYGGPMVRRVVDMLRHPDTARTNVFIGAPVGGRRGGAGSGATPPTPEGPPPPEHVVREIEQAIRRSGGDVNAFANEVEAIQQSFADDVAQRGATLGFNAQVRPFGATAADSQVAPELGVLADTFANMPGETRSLAQGRLQRLNATMDDDLVEEARHFLNANATPSSLHDSFQEMVGKISGAYNSLLNGGGGVNRNVLLNELAPITRDPIMQPVMARRFQQEELEAQAARTFGRTPPTRTIRRVQNPDGTMTYEMDENISGRGLQQIKKAIDQETGAGQNVQNLSVSEQERMNTLREYRREWVRRMGRAIPGYDQLRNQRQGLFRAMEALDLDNNGHSRVGSRFLRMRPDEIRRRMARVTDDTGVTRDTTEAEQAVYRMAVADELVNNIEKYVSDMPTSTRNAAEPLSRSILRERVRAVFGNDPRVDRFFDRAMERGRLMVNMRSILGNSASARRISHALEQSGSGILDMLRGGDAVGLARALHMKHAMESRNNEIGRYLLRDLTTPEGRAVWERLMPALRKFEEDRIARSTGAGGYGIGATGYNSLYDMLDQMGLTPSSKTAQ